jgi:hypothetical protein
MKKVLRPARVAKHLTILATLFSLGLVSLCAKPTVKRAIAGERPKHAKSAVSLAAIASDSPEELLPETAPVDESQSQADSSGSRHDSTRNAPRDLLHGGALLAFVQAAESASAAANAIDGSEETSWQGAERAAQWEWKVAFRKPVHVGVLRGVFGDGSATSGVPVAYHWEARAPRAGGCDEDVPFERIRDAEDTGPAKPTLHQAEATRKSWFADVDACALRLVIDRTNGGAPMIRELFAIESARDVLLDASASDDGALAGFSAENAIDGSYERRWVGEPGRSKWTLVVRLREPTSIDRIRLVTGFDGVAHPRRSAGRKGVGRTYGVSWAPVGYALEGSEDGVRFTTLATAPKRDDGSSLPLRRRMVHLANPRPLRAIRLTMFGATGESGEPDLTASPVVREIAAYRAGDRAHVIPPPWVLSVNANPSIGTHTQRGGELANDVYYAKFLQMRFASLVPGLRRDDRYARSMGPRGELLETFRGEADGVALESIESDDELLDPALLAQSSPPPITVLSGSNDWEYGARTESDVATGRKRWHWDPLPDALHGGMGQLHRAVKQRVAPMLGFCGGAQILALLEAKPERRDTSESDAQTIDAVLRRTTGRPIRGYAPPSAIERAWPGELQEREEVAFDPAERLFWDLAGPSRRRVTHAFPESHSDVVRPDAFLAGGPLARFVVVAQSEFCGDDVVDAGPEDTTFPSPTGKGRCVRMPEVFRARDGRYPLIGAQFHAEQRDFPVAAGGDPPESVADGRLFVAAAYETIVDALIKSSH